MNKRIGLAGLIGMALIGCGGDLIGLSFGGAFQSRLVAGSSAAGSADGIGAKASFSNPVNVAADYNGNILVCDYDNDLLRVIDTKTNTVRTLVKDPKFNRPFGIVVTTDEEIYVECDGNDLGERNATTGTIWKVDAKSGALKLIKRNIGRPRGICEVESGVLALSDIVKNTISILDLDTGTISILAGKEGSSGFKDGAGSEAQFSRPYGIAMLNKDIIVADQDNNAIRRVTQSGVVTTLAGLGTAGYKDGDRKIALFNRPQDVAVDSENRIFVSDHDNHRIRLITGSSVSTLAGDGGAGYKEGTGTAARFFGMEGICLAFDDTALYVADGNNGDGGPFNRVRSIYLRK